MSVDLAGVYLRWIWWRAVLHNGWWVVTSVYLVVDARLAPSLLVLIGVAQAAVALVFEIPAGAVADAISRKWSLVFSHLLMGAAMMLTGVVTDFAAVVGAQMLWGLAWNFASGADVAWITDELDDPERISAVLVRSSRAQLTGAACGVVAVGALGSMMQRSTAMITAGAAMVLLGLYVIRRFPERRFTRASARRAVASWSILRRGARLVRGNRSIMLMVVATFPVSGAAQAGRLYQRRLVDLGFPADPVIWFAALSILVLAVGAVALRVAERRISAADTGLGLYSAACAVGAVGLISLAAAKDEVSGSAAIVLSAGIGTPLTRTLATIWVNRETPGPVRATVHSVLAQAEYAGKIVCGLALAAVAAFAGLPPALVASALLFALTIVLVQRFQPPRVAAEDLAVSGAEIAAINPFERPAALPVQGQLPVSGDSVEAADRC
jgi:MFS family permease